ncbi:hypothetical protein FRC00_004488 [Tulasnella sp. 408]|nr:hypothetical protein FRC00_004488 [Tulasnella sp. 408]
MASQTDIRECDVPYFTGRSAEEAEDFIQAVNRHAYAAGKQRDNAWIAEFAAPLFSRRALRWHEELDEGTQNDWKLLKQAILTEFTGRQPASSIIPHAAPARASSSSNLAPADPPPGAVTAEIGYVRVDSEDIGPVGYLFFTDSWLFPGLATISNDRNFATIFEADMSRNALRLQVGM